MLKKLCLGALVSFATSPLLAQAPATPAQYVCYQTSQPLVLDGKLTEQDWQKAAWTSLFVDIEGDKKPKPPLATKAKMLWDNQYLYIAAELEEPNIWAYQGKKDQIVYLENDFEVFIDPDGDGHNYFELEINARNNTFDLFMPKPYRNGGDALVSWDIKGLRTAVHLQGSLNNATDKDQKWTLEMALPFSALGLGMSPQAPQHNSFWRINFSRVQWQHVVENGVYKRKKNASGEGFLPENNWVWSAQGLIDMHLPNYWGYVFFTNQKSGSTPVTFQLPSDETAKKYLWQVYFAEKAYFQQHHTFTNNWHELGISPSLFAPYAIQIEHSNNSFVLSTKAEQGIWQLTHDALLTKQK